MAPADYKGTVQHGKPGERIPAGKKKTRERSNYYFDGSTNTQSKQQTIKPDKMLNEVVTTSAQQNPSEKLSTATRTKPLRPD